MEAKDPNYGITTAPDTPKDGAKEGGAPEDTATESGAPKDYVTEGGATQGGAPRGGTTEGGASAVTAEGVQNERTWAVLAHVSSFLNLFTLFLGPVAALAVWLAYRDRSREVAFQALQSAGYQAAWLVVLGFGWAVTGLLTFILIGFLLIPVMALVSLVPFIHAGYAAYKVGKGEEFRYPLVADLIDRR